MTTTELAPDPLDAKSEWVSSIYTSELEGHDNPNFGIYVDRANWCNITAPGRSHLACSRPQGHPENWHHVAASRSGVQAVWGGQRPAPVIVEAGPPDPMRRVRVGNYTPAIVDRAHAEHGILAAFDQWCGASNGTFICSRPKGHSLSWRHVAANEEAVTAAWFDGVAGGDGDDPFGHVSVGDNCTDVLASHGAYRYSHDTYGIRVRNENYCRETHEDHGSRTFCTRAVGHVGKHVATASHGSIIWIKDNVLYPTLVELASGEDVDPEDGTPADDESAVLTSAPTLGVVVRLKDRANRLFPLGTRSNGDVEVLDLRRGELRVMALNQLVGVEDSMLTESELAQITAWYAGHRTEVRRIAVREYEGGRWCHNGLNEQLGVLGMERHKSVLTGKWSVQIPFRHTNPDMTSSQLEALFVAAMQVPEILAAVRSQLPNIDNIMWMPEQSKLRATDLHRK